MPKLDRQEVIRAFYKLSPGDCQAIMGNIVETMLHYKDRTAKALWKQMVAHVAHKEAP